MPDYYGVQRSEEYLEHYGVRGMKWGVRKNPQKDFYKEMKKQFKKSLQNNIQKQTFDTSAVREISKSIPDSKLKKYYKYRDELDAVNEKHNDLENYIYHLKNHEDKEPSKKQFKTMKNLEKKTELAYNKYTDEVNRLSNEYLGKYTKKKIRTDSPYGYKRDRADYLFSAALSSRANRRIK